MVTGFCLNHCGAALSSDAHLVQCAAAGRRAPDCVRVGVTWTLVEGLLESRFPFFPVKFSSRWGDRSASSARTHQCLRAGARLPGRGLDAACGGEVRTGQPQRAGGHRSGHGTAEKTCLSRPRVLVAVSAAVTRESRRFGEKWPRRRRPSWLLAGPRGPPSGGDHSHSACVRLLFNLDEAFTCDSFPSDTALCRSDAVYVCNCEPGNCACLCRPSHVFADLLLRGNM